MLGMVSEGISDGIHLSIELLKEAADLSLLKVRNRLCAATFAQYPLPGIGEQLQGHGLAEARQPRIHRDAQQIRFNGPT
jgi:hypothetical protein